VFENLPLLDFSFESLGIMNLSAESFRDFYYRLSADENLLWSWMNIKLGYGP